jgi:hypothetical protein
LSFAHRARWNAAIFLRAADDMTRLAGAEATVFVSFAGCVPFRALAHRSFCAFAIFRREAAEITLTGRVAL